MNDLCLQLKGMRARRPLPPPPLSQDNATRQAHPSASLCMYASMYAHRQPRNVGGGTSLPKQEKRRLHERSWKNKTRCFSIDQPYVHDGGGKAAGERQNNAGRRRLHQKLRGDAPSGHLLGAIPAAPAVPRRPVSAGPPIAPATGVRGQGLHVNFRFLEFGEGAQRFQQSTARV